MVLDKKHIPLYKRALSFIKPVWLSGGSSPINPRLEVLLYHDRIQLATGDALYSDGKYYTPATEIAKYLDKDLPQFEQVLMLGVGLGSLVDVLAEKGCTPAFTLVEKDEVVLRLATNYLQKWPKLQLTPMVEDAQEFMERNHWLFDFIFIDIFNSREVPAFVNSTAFLQQCRDSLMPGGKVAFNYIVNDKEEWESTQQKFAGVFPHPHIIYNDINRIFIGSKPL